MSAIDIEIYSIDNNFEVSISTILTSWSIEGAINDKFTLRLIFGQFDIDIFETFL